MADIERRQGLPWRVHHGQVLYLFDAGVGVKNCPVRDPQGHRGGYVACGVDINDEG